MIPLVPLLLATCSPDGSGPGGRRDVIVTVTGSRLGVEEVLADALAGVRYRAGGSERVLPASQVLRIEWRDEPPALRRARERRAAGEFAAASRALAAALEARGVRPWLREEVAFESAGLLEAWGATVEGKTAEAAEAYRAFAEAHASSRRFPAALLGRSRCLRSLQRHDEALALLGEAGGGVSLLGEEAQLEADFEKAQTLLAAGRAGEARRTLGSLEARIPAPSPLLARVRAAQGDCLLAEGRAAEALSHFRGLLAEAGSAFAPRATARAGEGEALLAAGRVREAIYALAEARATGPAGLPSVPRATYLLAECHRRLSGEEPDAERLARAYLAEVANRHPSSPWAGKARRALGE
ncbi:MAG: tetratricopeptide repeat protein [Planctomycetes bacterium]|nr:tetratricopeptide repeat protein [Planctomycetota bacterium]